MNRQQRQLYEKIIQDLKDKIRQQDLEIEILKTSVFEESQAKYAAWNRIVELRTEIPKNSDD